MFAIQPAKSVFDGPAGAWNSAFGPYYPTCKVAFITINSSYTVKLACCCLFGADHAFESLPFVDADNIFLVGPGINLANGEYPS